jgi:hypothetical protein
MLYICKSHLSIIPYAITGVMCYSKLAVRLCDTSPCHAPIPNFQHCLYTTRYTQWSHTLCTWRYPEVLLAQEQLKAKHLSGIGSPGSPDQLLRHSSVSGLCSGTRMLEQSMTAWCACDGCP